MPIEMFQFQLENATMISPRVKHFVLTNTDGNIFDHKPGQFITILFEHQGKVLRRSYSIANAPQTNHRIEFAASYVKSGPGSEYLFHLKAGDKIHVSGPFGKLILREKPPRRYIFLATSTGITPYRAMIPTLQQQLAENPELSVVVFQGVPKQDDILYAEDFLNLAAQSPRVLFRAYLSRETLEQAPPHINYGHIEKGFADLNLNAEQDFVYLCGNPAMIDESFDLLKDQGFSTQQIIREKYISSSK
jgi:ferredoxin-NADP reductase